MASVNKRKWTRNGKSGESWQVSWVEQGQQRKKAGFRTKKEADAWLIQKEHSLLVGTSRPDAHLLTINDLAKSFVEETRKRVERGAVGYGHIRNIQSHLYNYICRPADWSLRSPGGKISARAVTRRQDKAQHFRGGIGHMRLSDVRPRTMDDFKDQLYDVGLNHQTIRAVMITAASMLKFAVRKEMIAVNPATTDVEVPLAEKLKKVTAPPAESVRAAVESADEPLSTLVLTAAATGLRSGELRALRWGDVDLKQRTLSVERAIKFRTGEGVPKTHAGVRTIPLARATVVRLTSFKRSSEHSEDGDFIFPGRGGMPLSENIIRVWLYKLFDHEGWPARSSKHRDRARTRFHPHGLRHFAVSSWIAAGADPMTVQTWAGHSSIQMTMDTYGHLFPDTDHATKMEKAAKFVS